MEGQRRDGPPATRPQHTASEASGSRRASILLRPRAPTLTLALVVPGPGVGLITCLFIPGERNWTDTLHMGSRPPWVRPRAVAWSEATVSACLLWEMWPLAGSPAISMTVPRVPLPPRSPCSPQALEASPGHPFWVGSPKASAL